jgi:hypothetical protein
MRVGKEVDTKDSRFGRFGSGAPKTVAPWKKINRKVCI